MIKSILHFFVVMFSWLRFPLYFILAIIVFFGLLTGIYVLVDMRRGFRFKRTNEKVFVNIKRHGFFRSFFIDAPKQFAHDLLTRNPGFFKYQGCIVYTGRQGAGKTVASVEFIRFMQKQFPKAKVITNCAYKYQNGELKDWRPLITYKNGIYGVIAFIDEMQNWFSSNQSKDFPPEMLEVITQNRKNRRIIIGTAQCFNRLSKPLREQTTEVRECHTVLGCFTWVVRKEPFLDSTGEVDHWKFKGVYFFAHSKEIRESYDTYRVVDSLAKSGFQPRSEQLSVIQARQDPRAGGALLQVIEKKK